MFLATAISVLMKVGAMAFREIPTPEDTISQWLRIRRYIVVVVLIAAALRIVLHSSHLWTFSSLITFLLTTFVVTPLVERQNAHREPKF